MQFPKPGGTREQTAVAAWLDVANQTHARLSSTVDVVPSLLTGFDTWAAAGAHFGECELHARSLDRSLILDIFEERRPWLESQVAHHNETGLDLLERARATLPDLRRELSALNLDRSSVVETTKQLERAVREHLANWEMKGSDAKKLMDSFMETLQVVQSSGISGLADHLDRTLGDLVAGRRKPDRGTYDNIPWWKWMFLWGAFGWMVAWAIVNAVYRGQYSTIINAGWVIIEITHWVAFVLFC